MSENIITEEWKPSKNPWLIATPMMIAVFMYALDETISNVALPYMAGSFSCSHTESTWIITSYLIASGIIIPTGDFFCKLMGRNNYFMLSLFIFTVSSFLCGISNSIGMMIISRFIQGLGGGGILPLTQAIMLESFPKDKRSQAMALFGLGVIVAPIIGPAIGGWITENWSWPFIYYINIPFGILVLSIAPKLLEEPPYAKKQQNVSMDYVGFFFLSVWLVAFQVFLDKGNDADWFGATWICWTFVISMVGFGLFVLSQSLNKKNPLVDLSIMKDKNYFFGTIIQIVLMGAMMGSAAMLPSMLQGLFGYTSFLSGLSMVPRGAGCLAATVINATLTPVVGEKPLVVTGLIILGLGSLAFGQINLDINLNAIILPNFLFGMGMILALVPLINLSCCTLKQSQLTNASGVQNLLKNIGAAIGTSIVTTCVSRFSQVHQNMLVDKLNETNSIFVERIQTMTGAFSGLTDQATAAFMAKTQIYGQLVQQSHLWAYVDTFRWFAIASFAILPLMLLVRSPKALERKLESN
ncbi:MAG: DHA2 family efflux MFS transporter permease subunit [Candidatus Gastranaerophilaceae bacterium]